MLPSIYFADELDSKPIVTNCTFNTSTYGITVHNRHLYSITTAYKMNMGSLWFATFKGIKKPLLSSQVRTPKSAHMLRL